MTSRTPLVFRRHESADAYWSGTRWRKIYRDSYSQQQQADPFSASGNGWAGSRSIPPNPASTSLSPTPRREAGGQGVRVAARHGDQVVGRACRPSRNRDSSGKTAREPSHCRRSWSGALTPAKGSLMPCIRAAGRSQRGKGHAAGETSEHIRIPCLHPVGVAESRPATPRLGETRPCSTC